ncbi:MAG: cytidine deaminase [Fidelibacterota bacterium]
MDSLIKAAKTAQSRAFAPFSNYPVGAAIETENGTIIMGCNVESASYGLTICAERVAVSAAVAQGFHSFVRLVVISKNKASLCGACRQVIWELCGDIPITLVNDAGQETETSAAALLPKPFDHSSLKK